MGAIITRATVSIRLPTGRFPRESQAAALRAVVPRLAADAKAAFDQRRDPATLKPWPPRKVARGRKPLPHPLMVLTGKLKRATVEAAEGATITGSTLTMKVKSPKYAKYHAKGTRLMPARPSVGVSRAARMILAKQLVKQGLRVFRSRGVR